MDKQEIDRLNMSAESGRIRIQKTVDGVVLCIHLKGFSNSYENVVLSRPEARELAKELIAKTNTS